MAISIFRSTDAGAPTLIGTSGSMVALLDAVLVDGYGAVSPLGWTKAYTDTKKASYLMPGGSGLYFGFDDSVNNSYCRFRGFQTMTAAGVAVASGTYPFPNDTQLFGGLYAGYNQNGDGSTRSWIIVSNGLMVYVYVNAANNDYGQIFAFGDISSYVDGDTNHAIVIGYSTNSAIYDSVFGGCTSAVTNLAGHYLSKKYDGISYSVGAGKTPISGAHASYTNIGNCTIQYPDPIGGGMLLTPFYITESYSSLGIFRGRLPGIWAPCHQLIMPRGDILSGAAGTDLYGKTFESVKIYNTTSTVYANILFETSDTWDSIDFR